MDGLLAAAIGLAAAGRSPARAADWPTYRHDIARSGVTAETLKLPLAEAWVFRPRALPQPAWGNPKPGPVEDILELRRVHFDDVFEPVAAGGAVYFGSSSENKVCCLDAATGKLRWTFLTGGPVRLAPTLADGRVWFGCDDGWVYCLDAADGREAWRFRAAPEDRRVLGHGRLISLWPVRTGVLVDGGVAYCAAGIFPAEGVFLYALDAKSGRVLWRNDAGGEQPQSRVSPQGYLLASKTSLYVPMGRVSPAAFDRRDGKLLFETYFGKTVGGTYALLADDKVYTGTEELVGYDGQSRDRFAKFDGRKMVVAGDMACLATDRELLALDRKQPQAKPKWKTQVACGDALVLAGATLFSGGPGGVAAVDLASGDKRWEAKLDGAAKGLAVADGKLLAATDRGLLYCFAPTDGKPAAAAGPPSPADPFANSPNATAIRAAAAEIIKTAGIRRGYCLVLDTESGQLALELARQSDLMIYAVTADAAKAAAARQAMDAAGVYGTRVCVDCWPAGCPPYANYFANLIVSEASVLSGRFAAPAVEVPRLLKPLGGQALFAAPRSEEDVLAVAVRDWAAQAPAAHELIVHKQGRWSVVLRGRLDGAGDWTHQYANPANTACSDDLRVKAPLGVLWFGHPGPERMVNRHVRAVAPLACDGRLFIQGENTIMAYDAYNGVKLWQRDIPGAIRVEASRDCSNLAVGPQGLFVAIGKQCLRLDPASGETRATYDLPAVPSSQPQLWGYVGCVGKLLLGSRSAHRRASDLLFAFDLETGQRRWLHQGKLIPNNSIAVADGGVYFVDDKATEAQKQQAAGELASLSPDATKKDRPRDVRTLTALNLADGTLRWEKAVDVTDCAGETKPGQKDIALPAAMVHNGVVVLFGVYTDGHYWQQFFAGEFAQRRITAASAADGKLLWSQAVGFRVRPLVIGDTVHAEPWAFDLKSGAAKTRPHPVTGQTENWQYARPGHHCGLPVASPNCLFFRSYNLGYYDLQGDYGTMHFGGQRPGCWINFLPAGGLVLMPEASAGCMCPFPNMCSVVFEPAAQQKAWAYYSAPGPMTPVERLALAFGAPGDRRDAAGNLWLGYPRPTGSLVMKLDADASFLTGGGFIHANSVYTHVSGTKDPWLFAHGARGLKKLSLPLLEKDDGAAVYRVRLLFAAGAAGGPKRGPVEIKLQGKTVAAAFDPAAGGPDRAVTAEFDEVPADERLVIELAPKSAEPEPAEMPVLCGVEVVRQRVTALGCHVAGTVLSTLTPKEPTAVKLANLRPEPFAGTLEATAPPGIRVSPARREITLPAGARQTIALETALAGEPAAGRYDFDLTLRDADGKAVLTRKGVVEHLGRRGRTTIRVKEDAYVHQRYPDRARGQVATLLVDGGEQTVGDRDHALTLLKFDLDVPGKLVSVKLRLHNAGNHTGDSGRICLVDGAWREAEVTYNNRPKVGRQVGRLGRVHERQVVECPLDLAALAKGELSLVIDPTGCDGVDYVSREGQLPPELLVEFEPE